MPYVLRFDAPGRLAEATFEGDVTGAEAVASFEETAMWLRRHPGPLNTLWDLRAGTSLFVMEADFARAAEALRPLEEIAPEGRAAYVARPEQTLFLGLAKVLVASVVGARRERKGFTDYEEALAWLHAAR